VKFLVDAQLPPALARWLGEDGHEAVHVVEVGLLSARDTDIWAHARQSGSVLVTKDEDFAARSAQDQSAPIVIWLRVGNASNRQLHAWFAPRLPVILRSIAQGDRLIEVV